MSNFDEVLEYQKREGEMPFSGAFGVVLDYEDREQINVIRNANKNKRALTYEELEQFMEMVISNERV